MTASDAGPLTGGPRSSDVLLLGAAGSSGRLIAAELAARGLSVRLTGRHRGPLEDLAQGSAVPGATMDVRTVHVSDAASLADAIAGFRVVVFTIGPFARLVGPVVRAPLGSGAAILTFGGAHRRMLPAPVLPAPVGDLEAARSASGAPDVVACVADPAVPVSTPESVAWAEVVASDGTTAVAELVAGDGLRAMAAIAAETTARVLAGAAPGAWTAGRLLGPALITRATGARVTVNGQPA